MFTIVPYSFHLANEASCVPLLVHGLDGGVGDGTEARGALGAGHVDEARLAVGQTVAFMEILKKDIQWCCQIITP